MADLNLKCTTPDMQMIYKPLWCQSTAPTNEIAV